MGDRFREREPVSAGHPVRHRGLRQIANASLSRTVMSAVGRWCLWISDDELADASSIPEISRRIDGVRQMRKNSVDPGARALAVRSHQFREMNCAADHLIIVPRVSSEERIYIPCGLLPAETAITDLAYAMYDGPIYWLAILSSRLHIVWVATVCGQLETRLRYSNTLGLASISPAGTRSSRGADAWATGSCATCRGTAWTDREAVEVFFAPVPIGSSGCLWVSQPLLPSIWGAPP